jgi:drug/metabolite transporter (DMT)-like permease
MTPQTSRLAYGAIIAAAVLWGGSIVAQKLALSGFSPVEASVLRDIGGLAILLTTWWWQEGTLDKLTKADGVCWDSRARRLGNHLLILTGLKYERAVGG